MEPILSFDYTLDEVNTQKAVLQRHFKQNKIKTIVYVALLLFLAVNFVVSFIKSGDKMSLFLTVACLITLAMVFYLPFSQARMAVTGYKNAASFKLNIFSDRAEIITQNGEVTPLALESLKVISTKNFYCFEDKGRFFPLPKQVVGQNDASILDDFLLNKLQNHYKK